EVSRFGRGAGARSHERCQLGSRSRARAPANRSARPIPRRVLDPWRVTGTDHGRRCTRRGAACAHRRDPAASARPGAGRPLGTPIARRGRMTYSSWPEGREALGAIFGALARRLGARAEGARVVRADGSIALALEDATRVPDARWLAGLALTTHGAEQ